VSRWLEDRAKSLFRTPKMRNKIQVGRKSPHTPLLNLAIGLALLFPLAAHTQSSGKQQFPQDTFRSMLIKTTHAFAGEDYAKASQLYEKLEADFGREPEYNISTMQMAIIPAWAYACFMTKEYDQAISKFKLFLAKFPETTARHAFVIYTLAEAYKESGDSKNAIATFERFKTEFPDKAEANLAWMEQAKLLFKEGQNEQAFSLLDQYYHSQAEPKLRARGRLFALQKADELNDIERSEKLLLHTSWNINEMPELATLTFAAMKIADKFMQEKRYGEAYQAYRIVPPRETLLRLQNKRLHEVQYEAKYKLKLYEHSPTGAFWAQYYNELVSRVKGQLKGLEESDDYTPPFLLRYGQVFILLNRSREAWLVFEELALDDALMVSIREEAHLRWIIAARSLGAWDDALAIAKGFVERYPDSEHAPQTLFMVAEFYQELRKYTEAIDALSGLIEKYPEHTLISRWLFLRGYNYTLISENINARKDFSAYIQRNPNGIIVAQAQLWHALTYFFEKEYVEALRLFNTLLGKEGRKPIIPEIHPLYAEVKYRSAATVYAMRQYEQALALIEKYLDKHPHHTRVPEATVLRGDILMGTGELDEAIIAFKSVGPEAKGLFPYSVFQVGKIHKSRAGAWKDEHPVESQRELDDMIEHFQHYLNRDDIPEKARVSEALYWIGWAYSQKGEIEKAFPIFIDTLKRFGNERHSANTLFVLQGLHTLHKKLRKSLPDNLPESQLLNTEKYSDWIEAERTRALRDKRYTYYSRLSLFLNDLYRKKEPSFAELALIEAKENTRLEDLGAEGMGRIGVMVMDVLEAPDGAARYFNALIEEFPASYPRAYALYGLGKLELERYKEKKMDGIMIAADEALEKARAYLTRFQNETPVHQLMPDVALLLGEVLMEKGQLDKSQAIYEQLLRIKQARGKPHARALLGLSKVMQDKGEPEKAIAYAQRVYTVYRAYPELLAPAYYNSAILFEAIGKPGIAFRTYREMLKDNRLKDFTLFEKAQEAYSRLESELPPELRNPPEETDEKEADET